MTNIFLWCCCLLLSLMTNFSSSNFGDNSLNNEKQSKDGDMDRGEADMDKHNESHDMNDDHGSSCGGGGDDVGKNDASGDVDMPNRTEESPAKLAPQEERPFPRIQIKSPSKLAQEFHEKQKQSDANDVAAASAASTNENNRTNNNKSSVDLNTTPLYDEPAEDRSSYSLKEAPSSHSFASENHETSTQSNTDTVSSAATATATASTGDATAAVTTESADNCEN